jgi:hypothetical protein
MLLQVESVGFVCLCGEECIFLNREVDVFSYVGPCRLYIPFKSQDDFHRRGHTGHHLIFLLGGTGLSSGHRYISLISD